MKNILLTFFLFFIYQQIQAQAPVPYHHSVTLANDSISYSVENIGVLWVNAATVTATYKYPAGSQTSPFFASHLWFAGLTSTGDTLVAASAYYQNGVDFFAGPLDDNGNITASTSDNWNYIWKVTRNELDNFYNSVGQAGFDINDSQWDNIRIWPGYGNTMAEGKNGANLSADLSVSYKDADDFAPFVDVNSNGIYDPANGDYPDIKGIAMAWWVYNDAASAKTHTGSPTMNIEIAAKSYLYQHHTILDNQSFYEYHVTNRGTKDFDEFRVGTMLDADIGYSLDDYFGSDSAHSIGFGYNMFAIDGNGNPDEYGPNPPMAGIYFPGITNGIQTNGVNSVVYFRNNFHPTIGNPTDAIHFYNYLSGHRKDGTDFTENCESATGAPTKFVYNQNSDSAMCSCNSGPDDRRAVIAAQSITLAPGESLDFKQVAIIRNSHMDCAETNPWQTVYDTITSNIVDPPLAINPAIAAGHITLAPNPSSTIVTLSARDKIDLSEMQYSILNPIGQRLPATVLDRDKYSATIDIQNLPAGIYLLECYDGVHRSVHRFTRK